MASNTNKKINVQYFQDLTESYKKSIQTKDTVDVVTFIEAKWGLNMVLLPVQKFILKVFYGLELDNTVKSVIVPDEINSREIGKYTEQEFLQYLMDTGRTNITKYVPGRQRQNLILNVGRRGSKSSIASFISNYETYKLIKKGNPQKYYGMPNGAEISVFTTAPTIETASTLFTTIKNNCLSCSYLRDRIVGKSATTFTINTDYDLENGVDPTIKLVCGGAGSADIRGRSNIIVIMDEAAFFNVSGINSGEALRTALTPSIVSFTPKDEYKNVTGPGEGKTILISSPFGKSGIFYAMYLDSFNDEENTLMFSMYTTMLNPTVDSGFLKNEKRRNPQMFDREYGAKFSDSVSNWVNEETLAKTIDKKLPINPRNGKFGIEYYMGIDYAGKNDGAAVSIVHKEGDKIILDYSDVYYGAMSDVLLEGHQKIYDNINPKFSDCDIIPMEEFADEIKALCEKFPIKYGWFDQFNGYGLMEMLKKRGLTQFEMQAIHAGLNQQMYQIVKEFICSEFVLLPNHPILVQEILNMEETKSGSRVVVEAPNRIGFHDDIVDSFVVACYGCHMSSNGKNTNAKSIGGSTINAISSGRGYRAYRMNLAKKHGIKGMKGIV